MANRTLASRSRSVNRALPVSRVPSVGRIRSGTPAHPTVLAVTPGAAQNVLTANVPYGGASTYNVYRGPASGGELTTPLITGLTSPTYTDTPLANGVILYYVMTSVSADGKESLPSNEASGTPNAGPSGQNLTANDGVTVLTANDGTTVLTSN